MSKVKDTFFGGAEKKAGRLAERAARAGRELVAGGLEETKGQIRGLSDAGIGPSLEKQQALSGALGPEAQKEAFANFQESPGVSFLREQGLRGINASGAGVGGGNRLRALTKFSQGLALQDLNQSFNRLGVTSRGEQAVTARGQGLEERKVLNEAKIREANLARQSGLETQAGSAAGSALTQSAAGLRGGVKQTISAISGAMSGGTTGGLEGFVGT